MHLVNQTCSQLILMHCVQQRSAVGNDGDDERNVTARPVSSTETGGLERVKQRAAQWADRQRVNVNVSTSATHQCDRLLPSHRTRAAARTPTRSFLIMNKASETQRNTEPERSLTNSSAVSEATSGELR